MWKVIEKISVFKTPWVKLIGEKVKDEEGNLLDYWRVEKEDSVIVLPLWKGSILLPSPYYRHGVGEYTYDFPGGRILDKEKHKEAGLRILIEEMGIKAEQVESLTPLNKEGFLINSSFSNQKLYGYVAEISEKASLENQDIEFFSIKGNNVEQILNKITCLQCRAILLEWIYGVKKQGYKDTNKSYLL